MAPEVLQQKAEMGGVCIKEYLAGLKDVWIPSNAGYDVGPIHGRIATTNKGPSEGPETGVTQSSE